MYTLISNHVLTFSAKHIKWQLDGDKSTISRLERKCKLKQTTFRFYWWMVQVRIRCTSKGDRTYNKRLPVTGPLSYPRCWWAVWFGRSYRPKPAEWSCPVSPCSAALHHDHTSARSFPLSEGAHWNQQRAEEWHGDNYFTWSNFLHYMHHC